MRRPCAHWRRVWSWLRRNALELLFVALVITVVCIIIQARQPPPHVGRAYVAAAGLSLPASPDPSPAIPAEPNRSLPAHLKIPALNVDANVLYVGTAASGSMAVPPNITDVGWYKYGPLPGNTGSAVIAGHIDGSRGQPGVFAKLAKLQSGETMSITDTNGLVTTFVVTHSKTYGSDEQPEEVFHTQDGSHLNLITCTGDWDKAERQFAERLVVFADRQ